MTTQPPAPLPPTAYSIVLCSKSNVNSRRLLLLNILMNEWRVLMLQVRLSMRDPQAMSHAPVSLCISDGVAVCCTVKRYVMLYYINEMKIHI